MALPIVGSTAPPVRSAASTATHSASNSSSPTSTVVPASRVHRLELGVLAKSAARSIELLELVDQDASGRVGRALVLHDHRRRRTDGPEGARGQRPVARSGGAVHREVPPEVTAGVELLELGAVETPVFPVEPVLDEVEPSPVLEVEPLPVSVVAEREPFEVLVPALDAPGWSWATTMPRPTVAPAAARTAARVT